VTLFYPRLGLCRDNAIGAEGAAAVCGAVGGGLTVACLGVSLEVARDVLRAAGLSTLNLPKPLPPRAAAAAAVDSDSRHVSDGDGVGNRDDLRAVLLAGGAMKGLAREVVEGLTPIYDEPYSHKTDAVELRNKAAEFGCTHVLVAAALAEAGGKWSSLKVAAVGTVEAALGVTAGGTTRVSHGAHWYCSRGGGFGFAPNGDVKRDWGADGSHRADPLRLSWMVDGRHGGWRAGNMCELYGDKWRKLVWGFRL
jgi:hypothetical protein